MNANVILKEFKEDTSAIAINFEAADLETIKKAVAQWIVNEWRVKHKIFTLVNIIPVNN